MSSTPPSDGRPAVPPADAPGRAIRVLVVDDEPLGRLRVETLLGREQDVEVVATARNGPQAVETIRALRPDLVFLDVQMPGMSGLDVVREIGPDAMPSTVFVTAFDEYAVRAFDVAAVDYLVKPFDDERFAQAIHRARQQLTLRGLARMRDDLLTVLQGGVPRAGRPDPVAVSAATAPVPSPAVPPAPETPPHAAAPRRYLQRVAVEIRGRVVPVPVDEIDYITAAGPYAELHVGTHRYVIREAMQAFEARLDPEQFLRVHRSVIVRLALVEALHKGTGGEYEVQLRGGGRLRVSRSRREALERWLGIAG